MNSTCPHCGKPLNAGSLLAKRATGSRREFTPEQKAALAARLAKHRYRGGRPRKPGTP